MFIESYYTNQMSFGARTKGMSVFIVTPATSPFKWGWTHQTNIAASHSRHHQQKEMNRLQCKQPYYNFTFIREIIVEIIVSNLYRKK